jgi:hypothetical protein
VVCHGCPGLVPGWKFNSRWSPLKSSQLPCLQRTPTPIAANRRRQRIRSKLYAKPLRVALPACKVHGVAVVVVQVAMPVRPSPLPKAGCLVVAVGPRKLRQAPTKSLAQLPDRARRSHTATSLSDFGLRPSGFPPPGGLVHLPLNSQPSTLNQFRVSLWSRSPVVLRSPH